MPIGKLKNEDDLARWLSEQLESLPLNSINGLADQLAMLLPPGVIVGTGAKATPTGFLECDGAAVSRTQYAGLFRAIDVTYGIGDGSTTFNVPDLKEEVLLSGEAEVPVRWVVKL